jgi:hypothetical protein
MIIPPKITMGTRMTKRRRENEMLRTPMGRK